MRLPMVLFVPLAVGAAAAGIVVGVSHDVGVVLWTRMQAKLYGGREPRDSVSGKPRTRSNSPSTDSCTTAPTPHPSGETSSAASTH